jgi:hypothetical protein
MTALLPAGASAEASGASQSMLTRENSGGGDRSLSQYDLAVVGDAALPEAGSRGIPPTGASSGSGVVVRHSSFLSQTLRSIKSLGNVLTGGGAGKAGDDSGGGGPGGDGAPPRSSSPVPLPLSESRAVAAMLPFAGVQGGPGSPGSPGLPVAATVAGGAAAAELLGGARHFTAHGLPLPDPERPVLRGRPLVTMGRLSRGRLMEVLPAVDLLAVACCGRPVFTKEIGRTYMQMGMPKSIFTVVS